jgi:single-stranded DNA-specific DHH superfamily exonuclease
MDDFIKNNFKPNKLDIIIFHYPCQDGLSSAWVANYFLRNIGKEHELIPVQNNSFTQEFIDNLINKSKNKYVGIFDFSFNFEITEKLKESSKGLIILDHHITNKNNLEKLDYAYFDMEKSGVGLTWSYFNKNKQKEKAVKECGYLFEFWIYDGKGNKKVLEMFKE